MSLPWSFNGIDPHDGGDPVAALFGDALFDSLYRVDPHGAVNPLLADALPVTDGAGAILKLRPGLRTARGALLDARDVVASIARARKGPLGVTWTRFSAPQVIAGDASAVAFPRADRHLLARVLASPLAAIVPRSFDPRAPDGTGPFAASLERGKLTLARNVSAARGASFLETVEVAPAVDLTESLRGFEAEREEIGWLGSGLFGARKDAARFDLGRVAWVTLSAGPGLGALSAPGGIAALVESLPRDRLGHLGLGTLPTGRPETRWQGPPTELLFDGSSPHLREVAQALIDILSASAHELTARPLARAECARRHRSEAVLVLGVARPLGSSTLDTLLSLAAIDDPARASELAQKPPHLAGEQPRALGRLLCTAVLGDLRVAGGAIASLVLEASDAGGWDLGGSFVRAKKSA